MQVLTRSLFSLLVIFLAFAGQNQLQAQTKTAAAKPAVYSAENPGWMTDLEQVYQLSKKTNKPILANFTGSDWCGWCKRLTANVFVHQEFKDWAAKNVILLELDYPRRKEIPDAIKGQNASLQQAFQVSGFPTIWLFRLQKDETNNQFNIIPLGKTGYADSVDKFTGALQQMIAQEKTTAAKTQGKK
ncbi:MAG: thioredoxin family protein [Saprospiraceae bacterium]